jgi:hypothetical protein
VKASVVAFAAFLLMYMHALQTPQGQLCLCCKLGPVRYAPDCQCSAQYRSHCCGCVGWVPLEPASSLFSPVLHFFFVLAARFLADCAVLTQGGAIKGSTCVLTRACVCWGVCVHTEVAVTGRKVGTRNVCVSVLTCWHQAGCGGLSLQGIAAS